MRKILSAALLALAACGADEAERPLQYAAPQAPDATEQSAVAGAGTTLQASLAFQASTEPTAGLAGLGDQLVADLGGYAVSAKAPGPAAAKTARGALRQAFDTGGMDPACVATTQTGTVTTVTWGTAAPCHVVASSSDPTTGDAMDMTVDVTGTLTWDSAARKTAWSIHEAYDMTMTSGGETISATGTAALAGTTTVGDSTIVASTSSAIDMTAWYMGMRVDEGMVTTLDADLGYQADPFCVTSGTLTVEQHWTKRPAGATEASLPNQGWRFDWSGCGAFTVAHGS